MAGLAFAWQGGDVGVGLMVFSRVVPSLLPEPVSAVHVGTTEASRSLVGSKSKESCGGAGFPCMRTSPTGMWIPDPVCLVGWSFVSLEEVSAVVPCLKNPMDELLFSVVQFYCASSERVS